MPLSDFVSKHRLLYATRKNQLDVVEIETTTICNRRCIYCPNSTVTRPQKFMEESTFHRIIDSLVEMGFHGRLSPHFFGEPLMDDRLPFLLRYTKEKLPKAQIKLFTNGDLLTVDKYNKLCEVGVDVFRVSQHSAEPSKAIIKTLEYAKEHAGQHLIKPIEYLNYYNEFYKNHNTNNLLNNRGGLIQNISSKSRTFCYYVNQLTFDYEGNAVLCCNDYLSSIKFGNIMTSSIRDIWHDPNYIKARRNIMSGSWVFDICKKCSTEHGVMSLEANQEAGIEIKVNPL